MPRSAISILERIFVVDSFCVLVSLAAVAPAASIFEPAAVFPFTNFVASFLTRLEVALEVFGALPRLLLLFRAFKHPLKQLMLFGCFFLFLFFWPSRCIFILGTHYVLGHTSCHDVFAPVHARFFRRLDHFNVALFGFNFILFGHIHKI